MGGGVFRELYDWDVLTSLCILFLLFLQGSWLSFALLRIMVDYVVFVVVRRLGDSTLFVARVGTTCFIS